MVAAVLFSGLLTTHASAKAVVGKRSSPATVNDFNQDFLSRAKVLQEKVAAEQEELRRVGLGIGFPPMDEGSVSRYPSDDKLFKLIQGLNNDETPDQYGNARLVQALWELQQREASEFEMRKKHKPWEKRLEALANGDAHAVDLRLLEARRRGGPEFNPTGW